MTDIKKAIKIILKYRGRKPKVRWNIILKEIAKKVPNMQYVDFNRLVMTTTKNLKRGIQ